MGSSASPIVVVVRVVGWGSKWLQKGGRDGRRKKTSGGIKGKDASGGSFACTTRKRPRTEDDDDWGNKLATMGTRPARFWEAEGGRVSSAEFQPFD